ncbi:MAG: hypothetical protein HFG54_01685 [Lachnospiraceae bacterium]|nr:hypothetical protein [Lachnospiraceae bacterium]
MRKDLTESGKKTEKKQQKNRTIQLFWWTGVILIQMIVVEKLDVYAMIRQDTGRMTEDWENMAMDGTEGITIRSDSFADPGSCPIPESIYTTSEGDVYRLLSWEVEAIQVPDKSFPVEREEIIGPAEGITQLPENILVEVQEGGKTEAVSCHLKEKTIIREAWQDGFQFPVIFHRYQAGSYWLGDHLIFGEGEKPRLAECEELLLREIGVSPEDYQILDFEWDGEAYADDTGELCRNGVASGKKRMRDYRVLYAGMAQFPEYRLWRTVAVYEKEVSETDSQEIKGEPEPEVVEIRETKPAAAAMEVPFTLWERIRRTLLVTVAIGAFLFFGGLIGLGVVWLVRVFKPYGAGRNEKKR